MKNIDKVKFEWHNIECLDQKMITNLINSKTGICLVKLRDGDIRLAHMLGSDDFVASLMRDEEISHTDSTTEVSREWVEKFAEHEEFILYSTKYYEEYGEYAGSETTIFDNVIEIALIPDNPIIRAFTDWLDF